MTQTATAPPAFGKVPLSLIDVPPDHARKAGDIDGLKQSIESEGLINPIVVRAVDGRYELVAGGRRLEAIRALGWTDVPAQVRDADDTTRLILRVVENVQRHDVDPIGEARDYQSLRKAKLTPQQIAKRVGRSPLHVSGRLSLLELPEEYQNLINSDQEGSINIGEALALARLASHGEHLEAAHKQILGGVDADEAVRGQLQRLEQAAKQTTTEQRLEAEGKTVFRGAIGKDGWLVDAEPAPGHLYWPEGREPSESFQWLADLEGNSHPVTTNPLMFLNDEDAQVRQSAQALVGSTRAGTPEDPGGAITVDEAERRREAAERKHWRTMKTRDEAREAHLTKIARKRVRSDMADFIFAGFLDHMARANPTMRDLVYTRANVGKVQAEEGEGFGEKWDLASYLAGNGSLLKLAYAAALQVREDEVDAAVKSKTKLLHGEAADRTMLYLEHLQSTGYVLSREECELADLDYEEPAPEEKPEEPPEPEPEPTD